jgi:hypothetical protein
MNDTQIKLDDNTINEFERLLGTDDLSQLQFGVLLSQKIDEFKNAMKGAKKSEIRAAVADITRQATCGKITRSTASDRLNLVRFYEGHEDEWERWSYAQLRSLKSIGKDAWQDLRDLVTIQAIKFGGSVATPEAIRILGKATKGGILEALLDKLEFEFEAYGELTPQRITEIWKELGVSDVPDWQEALGRLRDNSDAAYKMDGVPQAVKDILARFGDDLSEALAEKEAGDDL